VPRARVTTARGDGRSALTFTPVGATDNKGELVLTGLSPGWLAVRLADASDQAWVALQAGHAHDLVIAVEPGRQGAGVVLDRSNTPVAGAELWVSDENVAATGDFIARSRGDGRFEFAVHGLDRLLMARAAGLGMSRLIPLNEPRESGEELEVVLQFAA